MRKVVIRNNATGGIWSKTGTTEEVEQFISFMQDNYEFVTDFTIIEDADVTDEHNKKIKKQKAFIKKEMAKDIILEVNTLISDIGPANKAALLMRTDVAQVMQFLIFGSVDDSRYLANLLVIDDILTQGMKDEIVTYMDSKILEFENLTWG